MATYNGIHYLEEQLESIRLQTLEPDEVIICDDASTDGTYEFLCQYVNQYHLNRWRVVKNSENQGWIKNFYKLFELTTAEIIFCADQDDIWLSNKIELMAEIMGTKPEIVVLGGNNIKVDAKGKKEKKIFMKSEIVKKAEVRKIPWNGKFYVTHRPGCALCFKKEILEHVKRIKHDYYPHDQLLWNIACILDGAYIINKDVILQRRHNQSAMLMKKKQNNRIAEIENKLRIITLLKNDVLENIPNEIKKYKLIEEVENYFKLRINFLNCRNPRSGFQLLRYISFYPRYRSYLVDLKEFFQNR